MMLNANTQARPGPGRPGHKPTAQIQEGPKFFLFLYTILYEFGLTVQMNEKKIGP